jgi:hypothetical protein
MYKKTLTTSILALVLTLGISGSSVAKQPRMHAALDALNVAEAELKRATHDKGGHRLKALELIKKAKKQVRKAIKYDNKH